MVAGEIGMRLTRSKIFLVCLLSFVGGVGLSSLARIEFIYAYVLLLAGGVGLIIFWSKYGFRLIALFWLFFILGIIRFLLAAPDLRNENHIAYNNGKNLTFEAVIVEEPDVRVDHQKLTVRVPAKSGRLLLKTNLYPQYQYGDLLKITCTPEAPAQIEDFAYDKYLARYDIYSVCWRSTIEKIASGEGNIIKSGILRTKNRLLAVINQNLPEPHSALLAGILLGARRGIPAEVADDFNRVGLTHIVAVSGSNVAIVTMAFLVLLAALGLPRAYVFFASLLAVAGFVIMTGASASVVRAGVMASLVLAARASGRLARAGNALVFTAAAMLFFNPRILVFDVGFQLSFAATLGLLTLQPILEEKCRRWPEALGLKSAFLVTMAATIMVTPLVLYHFGRFSLIAPLANVLIVPLIPIIMLVGFLALLVGLILPALAVWPGYAAWLLLAYVINVSHWLAAWRLASLDLGEFHWLLLLALYGLIGWGVWRLRL